MKTIRGPEGKDLRQNKVVSINSLFKAAGVEGGPVSIIETPGMYPYKIDRVDLNWAYYTAFGFKRLKELYEAEGRKVKSVGIVGIGSGVEGIAAERIFGADLETLAVSDIDDEVLDGADANIKSANINPTLKILSLKGSFAEPMENAGLKLDLIHGNIPNLPSTGSEDLTQGAEKGTFVPESTYIGYKPPEKFIGWALGAQFAYLQSAKKALATGGSVVTELGGRVPLDLARRLFEENGLTMQEVLVGFKEQTEALIDFRGYHRMEKDYGVNFDFYIYKQAKRLLEREDFTNPSTNMSGESLKKLLQPYRIDAGEALKLYDKNVAIGHTVHLLRGK